VMHTCFLTDALLEGLFAPLQFLLVLLAGAATWWALERGALGYLLGFWAGTVALAAAVWAAQVLVFEPRPGALHAPLATVLGVPGAAVALAGWGVLFGLSFFLSRSVADKVMRQPLAGESQEKQLPAE
jgi:hypothetical protein